VVFASLQPKSGLSSLHLGLTGTILIFRSFIWPNGVHILIVEPSSVAIVSSNAFRITFRRGSPVLEVRPEMDGVSDLSRFWASRLSEGSIVAIQGSFKHSAAVGRLLGLSYII
jgi:hypothetical protein